MKKTICAAAMLLAAGGVHAAGGHQHGLATLSVAVEGKALELEFESPLENLVGFERAPRTDKERQALQTLKERFAQPQALFVTPPEAGCRAAPAEVELPQGGGEHADLHAVVRFECATPAALRSLDVRLFDAYPRLKKVKAQLAAPGRQTGVLLTGRKSRLDW
ncbi:DUF2796 domain-containing protein [Noviherbaspirillum aridicola]|uniref:DUF2796 domain-containing protein n=1 Tax=Noviherbaspirillum aridicola TaxID=2849687 RepID=A0ABQ4Q424_9BURK|nr:DUF2796 domain-containing protein [Noviherbaspirillum aridicola]GIZ51946.1 hypothetical protein NCCP691_19600 [Noviherbaspirillum aridicola]